MAYTLAQHDALREAIAIGATKVRYRDREVEYRSVDDMKRILRDIEADIAAAEREASGASAPRRARQVRFMTDKGLC